MSELAKAIRDLRGYQSKVAFAKELQVTRQTVAAWEAATQTPSFPQAVELENRGVPRALLVAGHGATTDSGRAA